MTHPLRTCVTGALVAAVALPASAMAQNHDGGNLPARVKQRVHRVDLAINKAIDAIDDGDNAKATLKLAAVETQIARAQKAALRQVDGDRGPDAVGAVAGVEDEVAQAAADALDGADDELSTALISTLGASLDGRDALVAAITDVAGYGDTASDIADDSADEAEAFAEGVIDDELTGAAESAETDAAAQATATQTAATAISDADTSDEGDDPADDSDGDCPRGGGHGGPHGPQGGEAGPTGPTGPQGGNAQGSPSQGV
jgi:hypothetical protein